MGGKQTIAKVLFVINSQKDLACARSQCLLHGVQDKIRYRVFPPWLSSWAMESCRHLNLLGILLYNNLCKITEGKNEMKF